MELIEKNILFRRAGNEVTHALHTNASELFQLVKRESKTYGELKDNLNRIVKEVGWTDANAGSFLAKKFQEIYEKEIGDLRIESKMY